MPGHHERHVALRGVIRAACAGVERPRVDAVLAMCSTPELISASLPKLRAAFDGPVGAYANIGYKRPAGPVGTHKRQFHVIDATDYPPARYAEFGQEWLDMGAQIVGGCCASTPEHIEALRPVVKG